MRRALVAAILSTLPPAAALALVASLATWLHVLQGAGRALDANDTDATRAAACVLLETMAGLLTEDNAAPLHHINALAAVWFGCGPADVAAGHLAGAAGAISEALEDLDAARAALDAPRAGGGG